MAHLKKPICHIEITALRSMANRFRVVVVVVVHKGCSNVIQSLIV